MLRTPSWEPGPRLRLAGGGIVTASDGGDVDARAREWAATGYFGLLHAGEREGTFGPLVADAAGGGIMADETKMVSLTIEGRTVTVPEGTSILEAAKTVGVLIPHYCYHPSLPVAGTDKPPLARMTFDASMISPPSRWTRHVPSRGRMSFT